MINKKEDLIGTFIVNDHGELRDLYLGLCDKFGLNWLSGKSALESEVGFKSKFISILDEGKISANGMGDMVTTSDLKPIPQPKEFEWVNGDECRYSHDMYHQYIYVGEHPHGNGHFVFSEEKGITYIANGYLLKPESPEEKIERERMEIRERLIDSSELTNSSKGKVSAILSMVEDVYGSGALFSVVDLLEGFNCDSGRCLQDQ